MEDLLRSQIQDSCRLALPEGLTDLMSDISREVLRAQPQNLYQFITDYLSALLVTREHLFIAARVCDDACKNRCCEDLEGELRALSLSEEDVGKCLDIIACYFSSGQVKEGSVLQKLIRETKISQRDLPAIQEAVRRAFLRHQANSTASIESSLTDSDLDETDLAAKHTLKIYKKGTENSGINYDCVASKIQAAYRAYNVRRERRRGHKDSLSRREDASEKVRFQVKTEQLAEDFIPNKRCASKCSSVSLAGSFLSLPLYKPYSIGPPSDIVEADEVGEKEKERGNFNYVTNQLNEDRRDQFRDSENKGKKAISFHNLLEVVEPADDFDDEMSEELDEAGDESDEIDEDLINEEIANEEYAKISDNYNFDDLRSNSDEIEKPQTESSDNLSEDVDEVRQNEMERITQHGDASGDENENESNIVSLTDVNNEIDKNTGHERSSDENEKESNVGSPTDVEEDLGENTGEDRKPSETIFFSDEGAVAVEVDEDWENFLV